MTAVLEAIGTEAAESILRAMLLTAATADPQGEREDDPTWREDDPAWRDHHDAGVAWDAALEAIAAAPRSEYTDALIEVAEQHREDHWDTASGLR